MVNSGSMMVEIAKVTNINGNPTSEKQGFPIGFNRWFKIGFPFMIVTVAVGMVVLVAQVILYL